MRLFFLVLFVGGVLGGEQVASPRSTRTLGSFFGYSSPVQVQQQQVQPEVKPLVYQVRYYDTSVPQQQPQAQAQAQAQGQGVRQGVGVGVDKVGEYGVGQGQRQPQQYYSPYYYPTPTNQPYSPQQIPIVYVQVPQQYQQPCEYVYYVDKKPVVPIVQQQVQPGVVQPVQPDPPRTTSAVSYSNRVRPVGFGGQQQIPGVNPNVGVVPVPYVYDPYYHPHSPYAPPPYYNPVVAASSDYFYFTAKQPNSPQSMQPTTQVQVQTNRVDDKEVVTSSQKKE